MRILMLFLLAAGAEAQVEIGFSIPLFTQNRHDLAQFGSLQVIDSVGTDLTGRGMRPVHLMAMTYGRRPVPVAVTVYVRLPVAPVALPMPSRPSSVSADEAASLTSGVTSKEGGQSHPRAWRRRRSRRENGAPEESRDCDDCLDPWP